MEDPENPQGGPASSIVVPISFECFVKPRYGEDILMRLEEVSKAIERFTLFATLHVDEVPPKEISSSRLILSHPSVENALKTCSESSKRATAMRERGRKVPVCPPSEELPDWNICTVRCAGISFHASKDFRPDSTAQQEFRKSPQLLAIASFILDKYFHVPFSARSRFICPSCSGTSIKEKRNCFCCFNVQTSHVESIGENLWKGNMEIRVCPWHSPICERFVVSDARRTAGAHACARAMLLNGASPENVHKRQFPEPDIIASGNLEQIKDSNPGALSKVQIRKMNQTITKDPSAGLRHVKTSDLESTDVMVRTESPPFDGYLISVLPTKLFYCQESVHEAEIVKLKRSIGPDFSKLVLIVFQAKHQRQVLTVCNEFAVDSIHHFCDTVATAPVAALQELRASSSGREWVHEQAEEAFRVLRNQGHLKRPLNLVTFLGYVPCGPRSTIGVPVGFAIVSSEREEVLSAAFRTIFRPGDGFDPANVKRVMTDMAFSIRNALRSAGILPSALKQCSWHVARSLDANSSRCPKVMQQLTLSMAKVMAYGPRFQEDLPDSEDVMRRAGPSSSELCELLTNALQQGDSTQTGHSFKGYAQHLVQDGVVSDRVFRLFSVPMDMTSSASAPARIDRPESSLIREMDGFDLLAAIGASAEFGEVDTDMLLHLTRSKSPQDVLQALVNSNCSTSSLHRQPDSLFDTAVVARRFQAQLESYFAELNSFSGSELSTSSEGHFLDQLFTGGFAPPLPIEPNGDSLVGPCAAKASRERRELLLRRLHADPLKQATCLLFMTIAQTLSATLDVHVIRLEDGMSATVTYQPSREPMDPFPADDTSAHKNMTLVVLIEEHNILGWHLKRQRRAGSQPNVWRTTHSRKAAGLSESLSPSWHHAVASALDSWVHAIKRGYGPQTLEVKQVLERLCTEAGSLSDAECKTIASSWELDVHSSELFRTCEFTGINEPVELAVTVGPTETQPSLTTRRKRHRDIDWEDSEVQSLALALPLGAGSDVGSFLKERAKVKPSVIKEALRLSVALYHRWASANAVGMWAGDPSAPEIMWISSKEYHGLQIVEETDPKLNDRENYVPVQSMIISPCIHAVGIHAITVDAARRAASQMYRASSFHFKPDVSFESMLPIQRLAWEYAAIDEWVKQVSRSPNEVAVKRSLTDLGTHVKHLCCFLEWQRALAPDAEKATMKGLFANEGGPNWCAGYLTIPSVTFQQCFQPVDTRGLGHATNNAIESLHKDIHKELQRQVASLAWVVSNLPRVALSIFRSRSEGFSGGTIGGRIFAAGNDGFISMIQSLKELVVDARAEEPSETLEEDVGFNTFHDTREDEESECESEESESESRDVHDDEVTEQETLEVELHDQDLAQKREAFMSRLCSEPLSAELIDVFTRLMDARGERMREDGERVGRSHQRRRQTRPSFTRRAHR